MEYGESGDKLFSKQGCNNKSEALRYYGKAFCAAEEKENTGKLPSLLLKMGMCHKSLAEVEADVKVKLVSARLSFSHI